jgi:hypothetical protein
MGAAREEVPRGGLGRSERQTPTIAQPCAQAEGAQSLTVLSQAHPPDFTKTGATTFARVLDDREQEMGLNRGPILTLSDRIASIYGRRKVGVAALFRDRRSGS